MGGCVAFISTEEMAMFSEPPLGLIPMRMYRRTSRSRTSTKRDVVDEAAVEDEGCVRASGGRMILRPYFLLAERRRGREAQQQQERQRRARTCRIGLIGRRGPDHQLLPLSSWTER